MLHEFLDKWDYSFSKENTKKYNNIPLDLQLDILHKWYSTGMFFEKWNWIIGSYDNSFREVKGYQLNKISNLEWYNIEVITHTNIGGKTFKVLEILHPILLRPILSERRNKILSDLGIE